MVAMGPGACMFSSIQYYVVHDIVMMYYECQRRYRAKGPPIVS